MRELYRVFVIDKLQKYLAVKDGYKRRLDKIEYLETKLTNTTGSYGLQSGHETLAPDSKTLDLLSEIEILKENCTYNKKLIEYVEYGLEGLDSMEQDVVLSIYGVRSKDKRDMKTLESKYNYSQRNLYRIANDCLEHISLRLIGDC